MSRATAWGGLVAGVALLMAAAASWHADEVTVFGDAPVDAGSLAPMGSPDAGPGRRPREGPGPFAGPRAPGERADPAALHGERDPATQAREGTAGPLLATRPARLADLDGRPAPGVVEAPERVEIPGVGIAAPIDATGVGDEGALVIPEDVRRAGWFRHGAQPGATSGSSVIVAHVDSRDGGPGAFYRLRDVEEGDRVTVTGAEGEAAEYDITALTRYGKDELPVADLFGDGGPHRLVLITCGGAFDEGSRSYAENVVVTALPSQ